MAKPFAKKFYASKRWRCSRQSYIAKRVAIDGGLCEICRSRPGYIVDHIEELTPTNITDPLVALNHDNYQFLCTPCSNTKTFSDKQVMFTDDGDVVPIVRTPPSKK